MNSSKPYVYRLGIYLGTFLTLSAWPFSILTGGQAPVLLPVLAGIAFLLVYSIYNIGIALAQKDQDPTVNLLIAVWSLFLVLISGILLFK